MWPICNKVMLGGFRLNIKDDGGVLFSYPVIASIKNGFEKFGRSIYMESPPLHTPTRVFFVCARFTTASGHVIANSRRCVHA